MLQLHSITSELCSQKNSLSGMFERHGAVFEVFLTSAYSRIFSRARRVKIAV